MTNNIRVGNNAAIPGTSFYVNKNVIGVGLGNKLLIDAGISNTVVIGGWNRLMACSSTSIYLGTKNKVVLASSLELYRGDSHRIYNSNNIIQNLASISAIKRNLLTGGVTAEERKLRLWDNEQSSRICFAAIICFLATVGFSLIGMAFPPVQVSIAATNPATGEIYSNGEVSMTGDDNSNAKNIALIVIFDTLSILGLFIAQLILARKMANHHNFNAVANLSLAANGLSAAVFSDPQRQPITSKDKGFDLDWLQFGEKVPNRLNQLNSNKEPRLLQKVGSSPAVIFNMRPGSLILGKPIPSIEELEEQLNSILEENKLDWSKQKKEQWIKQTNDLNIKEHNNGALTEKELEKHKENIKNWKYLPHNNLPVITLVSFQELHKKIHAGINITDSIVFLIASHGFNHGQNDDETIKKQVSYYDNQYAGILLNSGLQYSNYEPIKIDSPKTKESSIIITANDKNNNGGNMIVNSKGTEFYLKGLEQHFYAAVVNKDNISEPKKEKNISKWEEKGKDEQNYDLENIKLESNKENPKGSLSEIFIDDSRVMLATGCGKNGFFADSKGAYLGFDDNKALTFTKDTINLKQSYFKSNKVQFGDFTVKIVKLLNADNNRLKNRSAIVCNHIDEITAYIKKRATIFMSHVTDIRPFYDSENKDVLNHIKSSFCPFPKRPDNSRKLWF